MFCLNKFKQLNIFEQVSELKNMTTKQPVGFVKLLADNFDINNDLPDDSPNKNLNSMLIYDTSGLKPRVKENNPKTLVTEINTRFYYK